ncbi:MAG: hypothetical protein K6F32_04065 [Bacilli bacterium]|nr:hypothetical protein [Bacilli bacterium]
MKKLNLLMFPAILAMASCGTAATSSGASSQASETSSPEEHSAVPVTLKVACPAGAPAVAFYQHIQESEQYLEINSNASNVVGYLTENSGKDIVVAPTNAGITSIVKKSAPYKIAATITFGNFYVASTGNDEDKTMNNDDYVVLFQQNNVPDKLFNYVYGDLGLTNIHYVNAASDAAKALISGVDSSNDNAKVDYVLMAEPALSTALSKNANASEYSNLQTAFAAKSNDMALTQASIFVSNSADEISVASYLKDLETAVKDFLGNPTVIDSYLNGLEEEAITSKFNASAAVLKTMASNDNRMGLGFVEAAENKDAIANFMKIFGMESVSEEVYFNY